MHHVWKHPRGRMQAAMFLVTLSWHMFIACCLLAWFVGVLTMATATMLGAAILEVYWEWKKRRGK